MIAVMPLSAQIRIGFARIGWAHVEALVVPLVLQRIALRDGGDASIERGQCGSIVAATDGGIGGQEMDVVTRTGARPRPEERRVGTGCVIPCRSGWSPDH